MNIFIFSMITIPAFLGQIETTYEIMVKVSLIDKPSIFISISQTIKISKTQLTVNIAGGSRIAAYSKPLKLSVRNFIFITFSPFI